MVSVHNKKGLSPRTRKSHGDAGRTQGKRTRFSRGQQGGMEQRTKAVQQQAGELLSLKGIGDHEDVCGAYRISWKTRRYEVALGGNGQGGGQHREEVRVLTSQSGDGHDCFLVLDTQKNNKLTEFARHQQGPRHSNHHRVPEEL